MSRKYCHADLYSIARDAAASLVGMIAVVCVCVISSLVLLKTLAIAIMSHVDAIVSQIAACDAYFASQSSLVSMETLQSSMQSMAESVASQIRVLPALSVADAARMNAAVQNTQSFRQTQKALVATAINAKVTQALPTGNTKANQQTMADARNYFTTQDWAVFENSEVTMAQKVTVCCDRLMMLGLRNPSERTIKAVASVLALVHCPHASYDELYGLVSQLKMGIHARRTTHITPAHLHVTRYPPNPSGLAQELYRIAYAVETPLTKELEGYAGMMGRIPLRSTNKFLQPTPRVVPTPSGDGLNPVAQLLQQLMGMHQPRVDNLLPNLIIHRPPTLPHNSAAASSAAEAPPIGQPLLALPAPGVDSGSVSTDSPDSQQIGLTDGGAAAPNEHASSDGQTATSDGTRAAAPGTKLDGEPCTPDDLKKLVALASKDDETHLKAFSKKKAKTKAKAAAKGKPKAKATCKSTGNGKDTDKAAGKAKAKSCGKGLMLGCSKCRGSAKGCTQCRDPNFNGKRFRKQ